MINRLSDRTYDCADIVVQFLVAEADDVEATRGEPSVALLVVLDRFRIQMLWAIEFDDELSVKQTKSTMYVPIAAWRRNFRPRRF